ncbi:MAG: isoleucine--tRNA ligase, partial [Deltaproteobacteria bacterium]|nr:isoleucine--tRNA ligase [Deltaproteobacteria bacterium]
FTSEEIWKFIPAYQEKESSIHLACLPVVNEEWKDEKLAVNWERLLEVRGEVTKALEEARVKKLIGHPLDASVTLSADGDVYDLLQLYADDLKGMFIVSKADLVRGKNLAGAYESPDVQGLSIRIEHAPGDKCERCWVYDISVGESSEHPTACKRCREVLESLS